jgi:hypothetical protein
MGLGDKHLGRRTFLVSNPKLPTDEELLEIAKMALKAHINDYHSANIEITAQNIADGVAPGGENWNLALIKMMLMTSFRVRQIKASMKVGA